MHGRATEPTLAAPLRVPAMPPSHAGRGYPGVPVPVRRHRVEATRVDVYHGGDGTRRVRHGDRVRGLVKDGALRAEGGSSFLTIDS